MEDNKQEDLRQEAEVSPEEKNEAAAIPTVGKTPSFLAKAWEFASELLHVVAISLAIIIPVRMFLIQPFYVKGASMEPNFHDHEYLIIDEISYRFDEPSRGDIVVFRYPNDPSQFFIKRVIGLPGERIQISNGHIRIFGEQQPDGQQLDESKYLDSGIFTSGDRDIQLGTDEYYLLGDNRSSSLDSRAFGAVPRDFLIGRVWLRGWPPEKIDVFGEQVGIYQ